MNELVSAPTVKVRRISDIGSRVALSAPFEMTVGKRLTAVIAAVVLLGAGCNASPKSGANKINGLVAKTVPKGTDAGDVVAALKAGGLPVAEVKIYTASDDDQLLGRPGQYSSKATFHDSRVEPATISCQPITSNPICNTAPFPEVSDGGAIEMFASPEDAERRFDLLKNASESDPTFEDEYDFVFATIVLRLGDGLTPTEASQYQELIRSGVTPGSGTTEANGGIPATTASVLSLEPAVRGFLSAVVRGDGDAAYAMLSERCRREFGRVNFLDAFSRESKNYRAAKITDYKEYVNGAVAVARYHLTNPSFNHPVERWVLESGAWHQDEC